DRCTWTQPPDRLHVARSGLDLLRLKSAELHHACHPEVGAWRWKRILRGQHSDDGVSLAIERDHSPDDLLGSAEAPLPQPVADHRDRLAAGFSFSHGETTAKYRRRAQNIEVIWRDSRRRQRLRFEIARQRESFTCPCGETREQLGPIAHRLIRMQR